MLINWLGQMLPLLDEDQDQGGGKPEKVRGADLLAQYGGDAVRMAEKLADLLNDNAGLREDKRTLKAKVTELEAKTIPDGATVLSGADAARWTEYTALGKPDEIKTRLDAGDAATQEATTLKRDAVLRDVADTARLRPDALRDFDALAGGLEYVTKDVQEQRNGRSETVKRVFVKADDKETPLDEYVKATKPHMMAALALDEAPPVQRYGTPPRDTRSTGGQGAEHTITAPVIRL